MQQTHLLFTDINHTNCTTISIVLQIYNFCAFFYVVVKNNSYNILSDNNSIFANNKMIKTCYLSALYYCYCSTQV